MATADGRFQQMEKYWAHYKAMLKLPDLGPISHDRLALQHIKEYLVIVDVHAGCGVRAARAQA